MDILSCPRARATRRLGASGPIGAIITGRCLEKLSASPSSIIRIIHGIRRGGMCGIMDSSRPIHSAFMILKKSQKGRAISPSPPAKASRSAIASISTRGTRSKPASPNFIKNTPERESHEICPNKNTRVALIMKAPSMKTLTRRSFLKQAAFAAGALSLPARSWSQVPGANHDIRMAVIGFNGRGRDHIKAWSKMAGVRLTALCDVDRAVLDGEVKRCADNGATVEAYTDIRKLLESKNVDAISIATPNHWHALAAVWGMQSGRDVYVEKPVSYDIWEGEQMIEAARRHGKMVQAGTQSRSSHGIKEAVDWVNKGNLGKILAARALCYKPRAAIGKTEGPQLIPASVDYDLWCGP